MFGRMADQRRLNRPPAAARSMAFLQRVSTALIPYGRIAGGTDLMIAS